MLPWVDVATGSLGQGLPIGVGIALAGKQLDQLPVPRLGAAAATARWPRARSGRRSSTPAYYELDNLTAIIDVNRLGQRGETMHGWDLDAYADRAEAFGWHAIEIDGHDVDAIDARLRRGDCAARRQPTVIVAQTIKGKGVTEVENKDGWHGKALDDTAEQAIAELGGERNIVVDVAKPGRDGEPHRFDATARSQLPTYELGDEVATRKAYGDALVALGAARGDVVALDGEVSNSTYAEIFAQGASPTASSRCTSPSSRWSRRRSACRCAAGCRSPRPSRRSSAAPTTSSAWPRSARRTSASAARTPASRSARTARRRWRSRTSP